MRLGLISLVTWAVLQGVGASPAQAQLPRGPGKWWNTDKFKQELKLTAEQSSRIEQIFQASFGPMRATKQELDREEAGLSRLMENPDADEGDVSRSVDRVEAARCVLSKNRTMMLFRIHRILTAEQRAKLDELDRRTDRNRDRSR